MTYCYGWNVPGFMSDSDCEDVDTFEEARQALLWEVERWDEDTHLGMTSEVLDRATESLRNIKAETPAYVQCGRYVLYIEERD